MNKRDELLKSLNKELSEVESAIEHHEDVLASLRRKSDELSKLIEAIEKV